jgi:hypothetical protein
MQAVFIRLGLSEVAAHEFINNGIINTNKLCVLSSDSLDKLIKQIHRDNVRAGLFISFCVTAIHPCCPFLGKPYVYTRSPIEANLVDEDLAEQWNEVMKEEAEAAKAPNDLLKLPEPFKKETKWGQWKESVMTYLHLKTGQASIPLAYIVREFDVPIPNIVFATVHDQLVECAILRGTLLRKHAFVLHITHQ